MASLDGVFLIGFDGKDRFAAASSFGVARGGRGASAALLVGFGFDVANGFDGADRADVKYATSA